MSTLKPHRRLSLTSPTVPAAQPASEALENSSKELAEKQPSRPADKSRSATRKTARRNSLDADGDAPQAKTGTADESVVRVMAYLSLDEAETLDELWMTARRQGTRSSKSDILRAALRLSSDHSDELTIILSQQHTNTLSRHRSSKMKRVAE